VWAGLVEVVSRWLSSVHGSATQHQDPVLLNAGRTGRPGPWNVNLLEFQKGQGWGTGRRRAFRDEISRSVGREAGMRENPKKKSKGDVPPLHLAMFPKLQSVPAGNDGRDGRLLPLLRLRSWKGWLASFHRSCRAASVVPASKTYRCLRPRIRPFLLTFGTAGPNQPVSRFREDDEGAERSDPFMTTGRRVEVGLGR
jgi:hypothetical protein